jgi:ABC-type phosphate transport system substrate-binding protein
VGAATRLSSQHSADRSIPVKQFPEPLPSAGFLAATYFHGRFAVDISGAGATFPYPIYAKWADTYKKETGNGLNYQSIGSGGGIKQIQAKTVTFGATDAPLKGAELDKAAWCNSRWSWAASCRS